MNTEIGNPLEVLQEYLDRKEYRPLSDMQTGECRLILELATSNGDWKGIAVNEFKITSAHDNFIEGEASFGNKLNCYFSIRYDATVTIHKMKFNEDELRFEQTKDRLEMYCFADIVFYMMKRGFNLHKHLS